MQKPLFLLLFLLVLSISSLTAQRAESVSFYQRVEVEKYQNKKFRFSGLVKIFPARENAEALLWARVDKKDKSRGFFDNMSNRPIRSKQWKKYTIEGKIDGGAEKLSIGGISKEGGQFFFDDFKLEIEVKPNQWEEISILNPGFEKWTANAWPLGWEGEIRTVVNYLTKASTDHSYEGKYAMSISSDGYNVHFEHQTEGIVIPSRFDCIVAKDGLPNGRITSLHQDQQGYIWIGTNDGLARYDGYSFTVFQKDPSDSLSLSANDVSIIFEDRAGSLWVGTRSGGLNLFNRETETFQHFKHNPNDSLSISHNTVTTIYEDQQGYIWIGGYHGRGLNRLDPANGKCKRYLPDFGNYLSLQSNWITDIKEDKKGRLWIATYADGLAYFDRKKEEFHRYFTLEDQPHAYGTQYILSILPDQDGMLWLGSENSRLYRFDPERREYIDSYRIPNQDRLHHNSITSVTADPSGGLWLIRPAGLAHFDPAKKQFQLFQSDNRFFSSMMIDREGIIWMGTNKGICRLNPYKNQFNTHPVADHIPDILKEVAIDGSIMEDSEGLLWVRTEEGLYQMDLKKGTGDFLRHQPQDSFNLKNDYTNAFYEDKNRDVWFGLSYKGLVKWDRTTQKIEVIGTKGIKHVREIFSILEDRQDTLWLGTWVGIWQYDREKEEFKRIPWQSANGEGRKWTRTSVVFEDQKGTLWVGTVFGELKYFDRKNHLFLDVTPKEIDIEVAYSENMVTCIYEDQAGILWIATAGNGFRRLDPKTKTYTHYTSKNGLASNKVAGILGDNQGRIWISTGDGLSRFNPQTEQFRNYNTHDGLPANELGDLHQGKNYRAFYLASSEGIVIFHPDSIQDNTLAPPVVITAMQVYNKKNNGDPINIKGK